ncbi:hypothetical protein [Rhodospira trueperi]|uniref:Uncharacterized protein n=1 Tax=Rhodospira trueperi TaxID=69960 RepID=A0A1G7HJF7_9PROT|nr:hypothetical protein [Rhodospira trueperi]SDF00602.1 hypothetical protein SAMN05421720_1227 [Rhodospira trueperi]
MIKALLYIWTRLISPAADCVTAWGILQAVWDWIQGVLAPIEAWLSVVFSQVGPLL